MTIPLSDARDFFRIIKLLDVFFTRRLRMLKDTSLDEINRQRGAAFATPELVGDYVKENPDTLSAADLDTVRSWPQHIISGQFLIHKERKDGCLFSNSGKNPGQSRIYLVKGLTQPISELVPFLPCFVEARLLPFRGHIITDGLIAPMMVSLGRNMRTSFAAELKESLATSGLITTLPAGAAPAGDPAQLLARYLSTAAGRRDHARQIEDLRSQSPALNVQYLQHAGKLHAKPLKAALKEKGITTGHFAVLEDTILAGAPEKATADACATALVPSGLSKAIVWFSI
jgi:hypothetical protein